MQTKYHTIDYNYIPTPCGVINCHQGIKRFAERKENKLDKIDAQFSQGLSSWEKESDINDRNNKEM